MNLCKCEKNSSVKEVIHIPAVGPKVLPKYIKTGGMPYEYAHLHLKMEFIYLLDFYPAHLDPRSSGRKLTFRS